MSDNTDPHHDDPADDLTLTFDTVQDPGWEESDGQYQQSSAGDSPGERTVLELPDKRRASPRRDTRRSSGDIEPTRVRWHGELSWGTAAAAVLAICVGVALAKAGASEHPHSRKPPSTAKPCAAPHQSPLRGRAHRPLRQPGAPVSRPRVSTSDSRPLVIPQTPATSPPARTTSPPAPAQPVERERQTGGGPFSP